MPPSLPDTTVIDYIVDPSHRRVGRKVNGVFDKGWLYQDSLKPAAEIDGSGTVTARFVYAFKANVPEYIVKGGNTYRIVTDHLGSVRLVVNTATGTVAQQLDYDSYGRVITDTNPGFQPFGFAGGLYDSTTSLVRFGLRDYDAKIARWTIKDLVGLVGGLQVYDYVGGDPLNYYDPVGLLRFPTFDDFDDILYPTAQVLSPLTPIIRDTALGLIDGLSFNITKSLRQEFEVDYADYCSNSYRIGQTLSFLVGEFRLTYAAGAKLIPVLLADAGKAVQQRNRLKIIFRAGLFRKYRMTSISSFYGKSVTSIISSAGKTNPFWNLYGLALAFPYGI